MTEPRTLFLCDCEGSMKLDRDQLKQQLDGTNCRFGSAFCQAEAGAVREALDAGEQVTVACGQEAPFFSELAEEADAAGRLDAIDIRDRAGWSEEGESATPKIAALLAADRVEANPVGSLALESRGLCLVYGSGSTAMQAAEALSDRLAVTLMLKETGDAMMPVQRNFPVLAGRVRSATGSLGRFSIVADGVAELVPGGREGPHFGAARDGGQSDCDLILDLSGDAPLFSGHARRDGYVRADPDDAAACSRAFFTLTGLVGTFEKPLYVQFDGSLCAHSRSRQPGCTRCLDVCPAGAITPNGDTVSIDPGICAGCGACASVCPSGAASYSLPGADTFRRRLETMLQVYNKAGGTGARVLLHGSGSGTRLLAAAARYGRGLPADVLPIQLNEPSQVGHAELLSVLAAGARQVSVLAPTRLRRDGEAVGLDSQIELVQAMLAGLGEPIERVTLIETDDPFALSDALYATAPPSAVFQRISPMGDRRAITRLSLGAFAVALPETVESITLPEGAPYGQVVLDSDACTLCLACTGQCPTSALRANPDRPELRFEEDACVQCGICVNTCPENALTLDPRFLLDEETRRLRTLKSDEPHYCISCGKEFGTKQSIARIRATLEGKHWMYADSERARMIEMCGNCRIQAQYHAEDSPFRIGDRPPVRTTEDYLAGRINDEDETPRKNGRDPDAG